MHIDSEQRANIQPGTHAYPHVNTAILKQRHKERFLGNYTNNACYTRLFRVAAIAVDLSSLASL